MSQAYICDKCGRISPRVPDNRSMHPIWIRSRLVIGPYDDGNAEIHLCDSCWESFEKEYLENLLAEGSEANG